jgi:hypothetical protein
MTTRTAEAGNDPLIESRADMIGVFSGGEKPKENWRIGTEHEKFVYAHADHHAPSYEEKGGIHALLIGLTKFGWEPVYEGGNIIALTGPDGAISLEPAGQFELSGAPLDNLHQTCAEAGRHLKQVKEVGDKLGIGFLGLGFWPDKTRAELPIMPKGRYEIMLRHMPRVGSLGPRHDAAHLHHPDQPRLCERGGHGEEVPRQPGACSRWRPRSSPTRRSPRASPTASSPIAATSGPTPIRIAPACCRSSMTTASATRPMPITCSTCRCISSSATANISMRPASPSATSSTASSPSSAAKRRGSPIGRTICRPPSPRCG